METAQQTIDKTVIKQKEKICLWTNYPKILRHDLQKFLKKPICVRCRKKTEKKRDKIAATDLCIQDA